MRDRNHWLSAQNNLISQSSGAQFEWYRVWDADKFFQYQKPYTV